MKPKKKKPVVFTLGMRCSTADLIDLLSDFDLDLSNRVIYLWDDTRGAGSEAELNGHVSKKFVQALRLLERESDKPVRVMVNSIGGNVMDGYAIHDAIKASKCHITIEIAGVCSSAGTFAMLAADRVESYENSTIMIHDGSNSFFGATVRDIENWTEFNRAERFRYYELLARNSNETTEFWAAKCAHDFIMTPHQAKKLGLIDKILKPKKP